MKKEKIFHQPVLLKEAINYLNPKPKENFIDATFGFGGHGKAILEKNWPKGKLLGIEIDPAVYNIFLKDILKDFSEQEKKRLILVNDSYSRIKEIVQKNQFYPVNGILFDLGVCSYHFDSASRGFSYQGDEILDMRFNPSQELTAFEIINYWPLKDIERIIREYGEERYSQRIAKAIVEARKKEKIKTTGQLVEILKRTLPRNYEHHRIHFATRTFQSLRIAVNDELNNFSQALKDSFEILAEGGRIAVITFHSLEDRIVKNFFKEKVKNNEGVMLTKKPIIPTEEEIQKNPRSHSAKLRAIKKGGIPNEAKDFIDY